MAQTVVTAGATTVKVLVVIGCVAGGLIVIAAMLIGMPAKICFANHVSAAILATFIISNVVKSFGIALMGAGCWPNL